MNRRATAARVATAVVLAFGLLGAGSTIARAGVPPPPETDEQCARFVQLQDAIGAVRAATTGPATFAAIRKAARQLRKTAAKAPDTIADDMQTLAVSFTELERALRPLAAKVRPTDDEAAATEMLEKVQDVFSRWADTQDVDALNRAQTAVDDWIDAACGFRLAPTDVPTTGTTTDTSAR